MQQFSANVAKKLIALDPANKSAYLDNLTKLNNQLNNLKTNINKVLQPYQGVNVAAYSNALEYFIHSNGLSQSISITSKHEQRLSIFKTIQAKQSIKDQQIKCLVSTSDVAKKRIDVLTEGLDLKTTSIDVIGHNINPGMNHYTMLMTHIANKVVTCLQ